MHYIVLVLVLVLDNGFFKMGYRVIFGTYDGDFGNKKTGRVAPSGFFACILGLSSYNCISLIRSSETAANQFHKDRRRCYYQQQHLLHQW